MAITLSMEMTAAGLVCTFQDGRQAGVVIPAKIGGRTIWQARLTHAPPALPNQVFASLDAAKWYVLASAENYAAMEELLTLAPLAVVVSR